MTNNNKTKKHKVYFDYEEATFVEEIPAGEKSDCLQGKHHYMRFEEYGEVCIICGYGPYNSKKQKDG